MSSILWLLSVLYWRSFTNSMQPFIMPILWISLSRGKEHMNKVHPISNVAYRLFALRMTEDQGTESLEHVVEDSATE